MLTLSSPFAAAFAAPGLAAASLRTRPALMQEAAVAEPEPVAPPPFDPKAFAQTLPGITAPFGFFDPAGFCSSDGASNEQVSEGKVRFYREVELKHGRVAMLAALGFPVAEQFHPLFATDDAPSFSAFQQTPLQTFWPVVVGVIAVIEVFSVFTFENPASRDADGNPAQPWTIKKDHVAGDLGFDPLGLKPTDAAGLAEMQTKELNNGRLAMIAIAGMVVQEGITGSKLF
ncbi:light harvesting protein [Emiliania huxleyi CCMP1516]|uniref:Light harvesting protein n=2 Tax=Emiliania huxleyi TaxID=2903 RepID=A0A0D3I3E5_EMIH1|nr:light harvesting protein [Emiliania huxleyi CCMP1516]EOD05780.1 light harvesting protein [Emiliania huxleyi CCMP1516]|eukprot:XP_005758209.1 light harvesting protein [Emiliania huxleyi CCMP1516]